MRPTINLLSFKNLLKIYCVISLLFIIGLGAGLGYMSYRTQNNIADLKSSISDLSNNQQNQSTLSQQDVEKAIDDSLNTSGGVNEQLTDIKASLNALLSR